MLSPARAQVHFGSSGSCVLQLFYPLADPLRWHQAVEVASNEHVADKLVEPFFIFSPFVFLWSGFKLFNKKWNLGQ